jgi:PAS domain S-box-containing protein
MEKKKYEKPTVTQYKSFSDLPEHLRKILATDLRVVVDREMRYVQVSASFAAMLGYRPSELVGKPVEEVTVERTVDIAAFRTALLELGTIQGLWLLKTRNGDKVLVRFQAAKEHSGDLSAHFERIPFAA